MPRPNRGGPDAPPVEPPIESAGGCLLHVFAQFLGVAVLAVLAFLIWMRPPWRFSVLDLVYAIVAAAVPMAWSLDRRSSPGDRVSGEPTATSQRRSLRARGSVFLIAAMLIWAAANALHLFGPTG